MSDGDTGNAIYLVLMLVLVATAFVGYRVPIGKTVKMLLAWIAIFAVGTVLVSFRHDIGDAVSGRLLGRAVVSGGTVRIPMGDDGHFWVDARINGEALRLMVDSGATITTLSKTSAARAGIEPSGGFPAMVSTANGTIQVQRAEIDTLQVGNIAMKDLPVHLAPGDDFNVIGMNFLSRLSRWSVEGRWLVLTP